MINFKVIGNEIKTRVSKTVIRLYLEYLFFAIISNLILLGVHYASDLSTEIAAWSPKVDLILSGHFPKSNFYGPGGAICLLPFSWLRPHYFLIILFYFNVGVFFYWSLCQKIKFQKFRFMALVFMLLNIYLYWLVNSSQDTVFEFALLTFTIWGLTKKRYWLSMLSFLILSETRSAYWVSFIFICLLIYLNLRKNNVFRRELIVFPCISLILILFSNYIIYDDPSPALEAGITEFFSYSKIQYLGLPRFDTDVFQSGPNGIFSSEFGSAPRQGLTEAQQNRFFHDAAIKSIKKYPKQVTLSLMEKIDAYVFDAQKIPYLPGQYVMNLKNRTIEIGDERLNWPLIGGAFLFEIWRSLWFLGLMSSMTLFLFFRKNRLFFAAKFNQLLPILPWVFGFIPGILIYTETRFKTVSEVVAIPFIFYVLSGARNYEPPIKRES